MPIRFTCPHCGVATDVAEEYVGQSGPCGSCGETVTVPPTAGTPGYSTGKKSAYAAVIILLFAVVGLVLALLCGGGMFFGLMVSRQVAPMAAPMAVATTASPQCSNRLKQIGVAMHGYHEEYDRFPPAYIADEEGEPMHSWRVLLLPYLGQDALYEAYDFDEPWDGPNNRTLAAMIPDVYRCPDEWGGDPTETSYLMIVGEETVSDGPTPRKIVQISDGASMTILLVESTRTGICWTEPRDLDATKITYLINDGSEEGIRSDHGDAHALYCDGSVRTLESWLTAEQVRALSTVAGGEAVDPTVPQPY